MTMKKKYSSLLKELIGLQVRVTEENGLCHLVATGNHALSAVLGFTGAMIMEIKEVNDDYIVLSTGQYARAYSLHVVVLDMIPGK